MKRLPTEKEFDELFEKCSYEWWITENEIYGYKIVGPNNNTIFLPAAGHCVKNASDVTRCGHFGGYWSSTTCPYDPDDIYALCFNFTWFDPQDFHIRTCYFSVRCVSDTEGIDLGLSIRWLPSNEGANEPEDYGNYYTYDEAVKLFN